MCGRYTLVTKLEKLEKRFNVKANKPALYKPQFNIGPGQLAPIITSDSPHELSFFTFGLTPFWAKKPMYLFNARIEGDLNKSNEINYNGSAGIINKPAFKKPIRTQRCLVPADCFFEGPKKAKLNKPYVVYHKYERPFAFAGVWDTFKHPETGIVTHGFSILTTAANEVTSAIGHHRAPLILHSDDESVWLNSSADLSDVTSILKPTDGSVLNAYPVSSEVKNPQSDRKELLVPIGERLYPEYEFSLVSELKLEGMGSTQARQRSLFD